MTSTMNKNPGPCPLCNAQGRKILFPVKIKQSQYVIVQCHQCELAQTFPLPKDEDLFLDEIAEYYGNSVNKFVPVIQRIRECLMNARASYYLSMLPRTGHMPRVLDIGCAEGRLLKSFLNMGCRCYGVEHKNYPESRFLCRDQISYTQGELETIELPEKSFDLIFLWHVLEHVNNPDAVINRAYKLLNENGLLVIAVPNFSSIEARLFKQLWFHLDVPWHKYHFTEKSVKYLVEKKHFVIIKNTTFCIEQNVFGLVQSFLNYMGWPKNELYEAIKGNLKYQRVFFLSIQVIVSCALFIPCLFLSLYESKKKTGSVLKIILKKAS